MSTAAMGRDWVGRVIDEKYPLIEWLGGSETSGVFLTELDGSQKAVIRLSQAARRIAIGSLSHPHLAAILDSGHAETESGGAFDYVVTEHAEEVLSQILPERALTPEETREMLAPVLDALGYLHAKGFVHGHLKPSHILVIGENLKLAADQVEVAGQPRLSAAGPEIYDAPEYGKGAVSAAEDMWSLGITVLEALTQRPPAWDRKKGGKPTVSESVPSPFGEIVQRCLQPDPAARLTLNEVKALLEGKSVREPRPVASSPVPAPQSELHSRRDNTPPEQPAKRRVMPLIAVFVVLLAVIAILQVRSCGSTRTVQVQQARNGEAPAPAPTPGAPDSQQGLTAKGSVVHRVMPDVSAGASATIHGTVKVVIRATVDANGRISNTEFQTAGPSKYFARAAEDAARSWTFRPAQTHGRAAPSVWLLRFEFRRDGNEASASEQTP